MSSRRPDDSTETSAATSGVETPRAPGPPVPPVRRGAESLTASAVLLAWVLSIAGHVTLFVVMFAVPWLSGLVVLPEDLPIPHSDLIQQLEPRVEVNASPEFMTKTTALREESLRLEPKKFEMMSQTPTEHRLDLSIIGIGAGSGDLSRIGLRVGSDESGPTFFGIGGKARGARRIVYVVDRSGSMFETMDGVKKELKRSIQSLRRSQRFHIVFYNDAQHPVENPPRKLVSATTARKADALAFIDGVEAAGSTNPLGALERAFAVKPDLVYFLSDGVIPMAAEVLNLLDKLNPGRKVRIFTIAYVDRHGAELLETIAREHRGNFRYVSEDELFD